MTDVQNAIVGREVWLEYFDQNVTFARAFTPQYCKVLERFSGVGGQDDWYLVELEIPLEYKGVEYGNLMIRSRWIGGLIGSKEATAVFIVLVPDPNAVTRPFKMDRSQYVAWGFTALNPGGIKRK
jgi:hypothetical protein